MNKQVLYSGQFLSRNSITWQIDIWKNLPQGQTIDNPGELDFPADDPVIIEWDERGKEEVICPSAATIRIESPGDRTYVALYSETPGEIGVNIYREGSLYWVGTLDPEQYEEPYEQESLYDVTLCFSDFGILERLKYDGQAIQTMQTIITEALERAALEQLTLDASSLVSSYIEQTNNKATIDNLSVRADNFYDEDGEPMTLQEVIQGILQPLGQRIIQRNGKIYIYDLNALATIPQTRQVSWSGDQQTLATDRVFNNIKLTFSPYADGHLLKEDEIEYTDQAEDDDVNLNSQTPAATGFWSYYPDYGNYGSYGTNDASALSFTIHKGHGKGVTPYLPTDFFKIIPQGDGQEAQGIAWMFYTGGHGSLRQWTPRMVGHDINLHGATVMRTRRVYLPPLNETENMAPWGGARSGSGVNWPIARKWWLKLKMEIMIDPRYNPFTEKSDSNEKGNYETCQEQIDYLYVPADIRLYSAPTGGTVLAHYDNRAIAARKSHTGAFIYFNDTLGQWVSGDTNHTSAKAGCWLAWYDQTTNRKDDTGVLGFKANRHQIGADYGKLSAALKSADDGQYIPYPTQGGWLEISVWSGICVIDQTSDLARNGGEAYLEAALNDNSLGIWDIIRWMLFKAPQLDIVRQFDRKVADYDDIEINAWVNPQAKEQLEIETVCGTTPKLIPSARGNIFVNSTNTRLGQLTRANRTDTPERLWIGTLYSQFATRHTKLTGEADIDNENLTAFTEQNQTEKKFIITADVQNVIQDTSDITIVELSPDQYDPQIFNET